MFRMLSITLYESLRREDNYALLVKDWSNTVHDATLANRLELRIDLAGYYGTEAPPRYIEMPFGIRIANQCSPGAQINFRKTLAKLGIVRANI